MSRKNSIGRMLRKCINPIDGSPNIHIGSNCPTNGKPVIGEPGFPSPQRLWNETPAEEMLRHVELFHP